MRPERIVVVVPAWNEAARIRKVLEAVRHELPEAAVLVVDDGSWDGTGERARMAGVSICRHGLNAGYGVAVQTGLKWAWREGFTVAVTCDADGQHEPQEIRTLLAQMQLSGADLVIGTRYSKERPRYDTSVVRRIGAKVFAWLTRLLIRRNVSDPTSGFRAYGRRAMQLVTGDRYPDDYPDGDAIVMCHRAGLKVVETPVVMHGSPPEKISMHAGLKPLYYVFHMTLSMILMVLRRDRLPEDAKP
ncbi:MAG: glycosyltransferase family 2 protein [Deltaproteobacteria bacterium]|nr:glycosyltransferase family 2 protein [Deltaproteobacteria bacterium]